jgi:hypothetical protein
VTRTPWLIAYVIALALAESSCTLAAPEIRVFRHDNALFVEFPRTVWRWLGLQDRNLCLRRIEIFDASKIVWREDVLGGDLAPCVSLKVPIRLGVQTKGFAETAPLHLKGGVTYAVVLDELSRVDFIPFADRTPTNITDHSKFFEAPCDSRWSRYSKHCR